jgi:alkanesulfonate monooxygenase SsuD/methylene tetrahydromethanopterin reductase-like flavin-dependent oxidoreductase (luciferase family)
MRGTECLAFVAASTTTILLGTGVLLLPFHHPVGLAKRLATIDVLSSGRMRLLTIGVSSLPGEAAAVGVDYACQAGPTNQEHDMWYEKRRQQHRAYWRGGGDRTGVRAWSNSCKHCTRWPWTRPPVEDLTSTQSATRRSATAGEDQSALALAFPRIGGLLVVVHLSAFSPATRLRSGRHLILIGDTIRPRARLPSKAVATDTSGSSDS